MKKTPKHTKWDMFAWAIPFVKASPLTSVQEIRLEIRLLCPSIKRLAVRLLLIHLKKPAHPNNRYVDYSQLSETISGRVWHFTCCLCNIYLRDVRVLSCFWIYVYMCSCHLRFLLIGNQWICRREAVVKAEIGVINKRISFQPTLDRTNRGDETQLLLQITPYILSIKDKRLGCNKTWCL